MPKDTHGTDKKQARSSHIKHIHCYTDGSSLGNPGPGGWASIIVYPDGRERVLHGGETYTTNNRMELLAAARTVYSLLGVDELPDGSMWGLFGRLSMPQGRCSEKVTISTDSEYVQKGITEYLPNRVLRNRKTVSKKPVQHSDLRQIIAWVLPLFDDLKREWVRGHNGHGMNERVDELARNEAMNWQRKRR